MMQKKYIKYLVLSLVILVTCVGVLNYIVDPLLYYQRDKRPLPVLYTEELRYLIPGLIKNSRESRAAIIGTSMAGNFLTSEVSALLNEKTIKLTLDGATLFEQLFALSQYLDYHPDAKIIIWGIDTVYIDDDPEAITRQEYVYPYFLYENNNLNLKYLLNYTVTVHSLQTIASDLLGMKFFMKTLNLDKIHTWPENTQTGCNEVIKHYEMISSDHLNLIIKVFNKDNAIVNLNKIVALAKKNKDVRFYLFLPPYSIVRYLFEDEYNGLEKIIEARNLFADRTKGISNIEIIDLQAEENIISNLNYYKDVNHYNSTINKVILTNILEGKFNGYESIIENSEKLMLLVRKYNFEKIKKCEL
jgi:hypothetical protein